MGITRKQFLQISGAAAVALLGRHAAAVGDVSTQLIDPHFHLWDLKQFHLQWLENAGPALKRDFSLEDYRAAIAGLNVVKSVYVEVDVSPEQKEAESHYAIGL